MEITLSEIKDLTEAVRSLAAALTGNQAAPVTPAAAPGPAATVPAATSPQMTGQTAPPTISPPAGVPVATPPVQTAPVPVAAAPTYTLEQLSLAARQLADAGRMAEVQQLVAQYGAQTMAQLPVDRYGDFATALRGMGARI